MLRHLAELMTIILRELRLFGRARQVEIVARSLVVDLVDYLRDAIRDLDEYIAGALAKRRELSVKLA
jgi:hypothetical protein